MSSGREKTLRIACLHLLTSQFVNLHLCFMQTERLCRRQMNGTKRFLQLYVLPSWYLLIIGMGMWLKLCHSDSTSWELDCHSKMVVEAREDSALKQHIIVPTVELLGAIWHLFFLALPWFLEPTPQTPHPSSAFLFWQILPESDLLCIIKIS